MTRFRRLLVALTLAISTTLIALPAAPASANSSGSFCLPIYEDSVIVDWVCVPMYIYEEYPDPDPCLCPWSIDFREGLVLEVDLQREYLTGLAESLRLVELATLTEDQEEAYRLREMAAESFGQAAMVLGGERVELGEVGRGHLEDYKLEPYQAEWLMTAGIDLADGLTYVSEQLASPRPEPWHEMALKQLDQAYLNLNRGPQG